MSTPEQDQYLHEQFGVDVAKHRATPVPGSAVSRASPAGDSLVPVLEIPSVPRVMLGVGESVPLKFRIQNYSDLPKWAHIDWWVNPDGDSRAVNLSEKFNGGEATVTVTAVHAGKATIQAAVKFGTDVATETYRFEDTVFVVKADSFVPVLEIPSVPRVMLGVGESLPLKFRIQNHGDLPKGTNIDWWVNPDGRAVNLSGQKFNGGEATVTVTAAHAGKATIQAAVKVRSDDAAVDYVLKIRSSW
jgi:hypothetical protein